MKKSVESVCTGSSSCMLCGPFPCLKRFELDDSVEELSVSEMLEIIRRDLGLCHVEGEEA